MIALRPVHYVLIATLAAFGYSLTADFHLDDYSIAGNAIHWKQVFDPLETRPVTQLTFWLNVKLGRQHPVGYHAVNLALHLANVWLLAGLAPPAGVALFALHPIQAEAVNYVFARGTLLATLFCLLAWRDWNRKRDWRAVAWFAFALLSKQDCVTFPLFLTLVRRWNHTEGAFGKPVIAMLGLSLLAGLRTLYATAVIAGSGAGPQAGIHPLHYFSAQGFAVLRYMRLLVAPWGFTVDPEIPVAGGWLAWLAVLLLLAAAARLSHSGGRLFAWLLLIAPSSTLLPAQDLAADRRMYLPMVALAAALPWRRSATLILTLALAALSAGRTWVWASEKRLWTEAVERAPNKLRPRLQLARASDPEAALQILKEAERLAPADPQPASERGARFLQLNRPADALAEFGRALALRPNDPLALNNRGVALLALGQNEAAAADFKKALELDPCLDQARRNLAAMGLSSPTVCPSRAGRP